MTEHHLGCDLSKWQGANGASASLLDDLTTAGVEFGVFRASIGTLTDEAFATTRARATARGWIVGGYHFLYGGNVDPAAQAKVFVEQLKASGGLEDCLAVCDAEWSGAPKLGDLQQFSKTFRALAPNHPLGLYTASGYIRGIGNPTLNDEFDYLWDARWTGVGADNLPSTPPTGGYGGFGRTNLWQWGPLKIQGRIIDGDAWYGPLSELAALGAPSQGGDVATIGYDKTNPQIVTVLKGADLMDFLGQSPPPAETKEERDEDWLGRTPDGKGHLVSAVVNGVKRTAFIYKGAAKNIRPKPGVTPPPDTTPFDQADVDAATAAIAAERDAAVTARNAAQTAQAAAQAARDAAQAERDALAAKRAAALAALA